MIYLTSILFNVILTEEAKEMLVLIKSMFHFILQCDAVNRAQPKNFQPIKNRAFNKESLFIIFAWNGIPQILKERPKKAFKRSRKAMLLDILQTEDSYIDVDTIIV